MSGGEVLTVGDIIREHGLAFLEARGGSVTRAQEIVLRDLGACGTAALGGHRYRCDSCGTERIAYNSCRNRHCPTCLGQKAGAWLRARTSELLPVPYFHVVFTLPEPVSALALGNKAVVYELLFQAVAETLMEVAANPRRLGARIGFLAVLHTWSQTLVHHPHIHCVVPGGGLSADKTRWVRGRRRFFLPVRVLSALFRGKMLAKLRAAADAGELSFAGVTSELADPGNFACWAAALSRKKWVVYAKPPFGSPEAVLRYLARYTHRVAISNRRLVAMDGRGVTFRYRDRTKKGGERQRAMTLEPVEFIRRLLLHVLPPGFTRVRNYGFLANAVRGEELPRCRELLGMPNPLEVQQAQEAAGAWDEGLDELLDKILEEGSGAPCAACGKGRLRHIEELFPSWVIGRTSSPSPAECNTS